MLHIAGRVLIATTHLGQGAPPNHRGLTGIGYEWSCPYLAHSLSPAGRGGLPPAVERARDRDPGRERPNCAPPARDKTSQIPAPVPRGSCQYPYLALPRAPRRRAV